jgi:hypothetical protein
MMRYPRMRYALVEGGGVTSTLVRSEEEEKTMGPNWVDTPIELGIDTYPSPVVGAKVPPVRTISPPPKKVPVDPSKAPEPELQGKPTSAPKYFSGAKPK